jgi:RHS repeat-associated protein
VKTPKSTCSLPAIADGLLFKRRGYVHYELVNHLGNVLATVSDRKLGFQNGETFYRSDVLSLQDYYAFGMEMPERGYNAESYRYGFNGKENDKETGWQDYGFRLYDKRICRFPSVDPLTKEYPELTPYQFASNTPIMAVDLDGLEAVVKTETKTSYDGVKAEKVDHLEDLGGTIFNPERYSEVKLDVANKVIVEYHVKQVFSDAIAEDPVAKPTEFEKENPGISKEVGLHEDGHEARIDAIMQSKNYVLKGVDGIEIEGGIAEVSDKIADQKVEAYKKSELAKDPKRVFTKEDLAAKKLDAAKEVYNDLSKEIKDRKKPGTGKTQTLNPASGGNTELDADIEMTKTLGAKTYSRGEKEKNVTNKGVKLGGQERIPDKPKKVEVVKKAGG